MASLDYLYGPDGEHRERVAWADIMRAAGELGAEGLDLGQLSVEEAIELAVRRLRDQRSEPQAA